MIRSIAYALTILILALRPIARPLERENRQRVLSGRLCPYWRPFSLNRGAG